MFGYVVANLDQLNPEQKARYRACYCGLCRALGKRFGALCRLTLRYDMVFLILLLNSLDEKDDFEESQFRCPVHPAQAQTGYENHYTLLAADLTLLLSRDKLLDDWVDERNAAAFAAAKVLNRSVKKAELRLPRQKEAFARGLKALSLLEKQGEPKPDLPARAFGEVMGEMFALSGHPYEKELRRFGESLGRFIYLMDASVDLKKDLKKERYNPLTLVPSERHEEILQVMMAECVAEFERLPIKRDKELMENILYSGVWTRYKALKKGEAKA